MGKNIGRLLNAHHEGRKPGTSCKKLYGDVCPDLEKTLLMKKTRKADDQEEPEPVLVKKMPKESKRKKYQPDQHGDKGWKLKASKRSWRKTF